MDKKKKIIISVLCGIFAIVGILTYLNYRENKLLELSSSTFVVTASKDILKHTQIDESMLDITEVPKKYVQPGAFFSADIHNILGLTTASPIFKNEQILSTKLLRLGKETGLAMKVPHGMRAVSILANDVTGVAGLIKPNDFVDVLSTFDFGNETKSKKYTFTLFQNVPVLAVNQNLGEGYSSLAKKHAKGSIEELTDSIRAKDTYAVTLALNPEQAQNVILAQEMGILTLSLRGVGESEHKVSLPPATPSELTGIKSLMKQNLKPRYREYKGRIR